MTGLTPTHTVKRMNEDSSFCSPTTRRCLTVRSRRFYGSRVGYGSRLGSLSAIANITACPLKQAGR